MEYQHGGDIYSREIDLDYSANINPLGLPEGVRRVLAGCLDTDVCGLYPDSQCRKLRKALGRHHQVPEQWVICGNGAADLIFGLVYALKPGRALVTAPSFTEYEQALRAWGCCPDYLFLEEQAGFVPDMDRLVSTVLQAGQEGAPYDMVFLCNPNNPTGIPVPSRAVTKAVSACRQTGTLLVVDECFCDFLDQPQLYSVIPDLGDYGNLFVLKAFTKLYAMAGLRLGYGLCCDGALMEALQMVRQPWSVSGLAQMAGEAALEEQEYVERTRKLMGTERAWLTEGLKKLGCTVYDSQANYVFFKTKLGEELGRRLLEKRVLIRSCGNYPGLDGSFYRICVKNREENKDLLGHMRAVFAEASGSREKTDFGTQENTDLGTQENTDLGTRENTDLGTQENTDLTGGNS
ncbi:pyridoxal phosphate-dependent aminotransferase [Enterocloster citroniae]